jgi:hypothetical protein
MMNVTRWLSNYNMANKFIELESPVKNILEFEGVVLKIYDCQDLDNLMIQLSKFQSITRCLMVQGCSPIMEGKDFELGFVKVLAGNHLNLTSLEKREIH